MEKTKQYFIPMQVTPKIIEEFGINAEEVQWTKIGNKSVRAIMVPATEEQYYAYMRPLWREDKQNQRASKQEDEGKMKPVSLDQLYEDTEYEAVDPETDVEATLMKRLLIAELHKALDELEEIDRTIMEMYSQNCTETQIGQAVGMSQRGVSERKQQIFRRLRTRLKDYR
jgi:RNA polymerase sigma factor (sigma-70 family)